jgi:hypothetical protein
VACGLWLVACSLRLEAKNFQPANQFNRKIVLTFAQLFFKRAFLSLTNNLIF